MDILAKVQERIKELMAERGMNVTKLAAALGVNPSTVSRYVRGVSLPTYGQFVKLLEIFNCSADYFLGITDVDVVDGAWREVPTFDVRFRALLQEYNLSQYALHKKTGFSYDNFNKWLKGIRSPYLDNLVRLAKAFECSVDYLIGRI